MSTTTRPELSTKNQYWIDKHRYYELKHFCLQYPLWRHTYNLLDASSSLPSSIIAISKNHNIDDPVSKCIEARMFYAERMNMVERVAREADEELSSYILKGVTEGISYDGLRARMRVPCCKDTYYDLYRRFFWLLSRKRQ